MISLDNYQVKINLIIKIVNYKELFQKNKIKIYRINLFNGIKNSTKNQNG